MDNVAENVIGILILLAVVAFTAGPALAFHRRERAIDRQLRAAERGHRPAAGPRGDRHTRYGRAA